MCSTWKQQSIGTCGIPNAAFKTAIQERPELYSDMYYACLTNGDYQDRWQRQTLVLLPKGKKSTSEPSYYRPRSMLDSAEKVLERIKHDRR